jgi:DNA polymerase bacteriophage-type
MTKAFWKKVQFRVPRAVIHGRPISIGHGNFEYPNSAIELAMEGGTLFITLPSGRRLAYPKARVGLDRFGRGDAVYYHDNAFGKWVEKTDAWHGTFVENVTQAVARDLLAEAMLRIEAAGYPIVLHVHDEIVAEVPEGFGSEEEFARLIVELPAWAAGLPIAAKTWSARRYAKGGSDGSVPEASSEAA